MYSRMDFTTSDEQRDAKSKKKYDLSLKRSKQKVQAKNSAPNYSANIERNEAPLFVSTTRDDTSEFGDSQNFMLRLSNSFSVDDTIDDPMSVKPAAMPLVNEAPEVIVISDSSDSASPDRFDYNRYKSLKSSRTEEKSINVKPKAFYIIKSSDSEDSNEKSGQGSSKPGSAVGKLPVKEPRQRCSILYTSNDLLSENDSGMSFGNKENNGQNHKSSKTNFKLQTSDTMTKTSEKSFPKTDRLRGILTDNRCNIVTPESTKSFKENTKKHEEAKRTPTSARLPSKTNALTKRETRNILKAIKSTRLVYDSPKDWKKSHVSSSDTDDSESSSPVAKNVNNRRNNGIVIAETDSDSDDEVVQESGVDSTKPCKTHVSRFLDPTVTDDVSMSEKKKLEIAHWLLTNSQDSRSDSSVSNISASQKNSPNSGDSSLERLEMNYETPNNRGKLRTPITAGRLNAPTNSSKSIKSGRQTTIDSFIRTSKDGTQKVFMPINTAKRNELISPAVKEATESLGLKDYADILDNLYGETWRAKANDLIPTTEPRKADVARKDKAIQTERKVYPKARKGLLSGSSSREDDFDKFLKDFRPNLNSTKKPVTKSIQRKCSFIHDSSSASENDGESTYMTALTTPRISDNQKLTKQQTPMSATLQRLKAICDSDTDDDIEITKKKELPTNHRKQLSFSDDESTTSTSEYDPSDIIPPKTSTKPPETLKTSKTLQKTTRNPTFAQQRRIDRAKTFLESLSATIPLSEAHPDAKKYRQDFKNTKEQLCKYLYIIYNDKIFDNKLPSDMSIEWNVRMRGTAGFCYNKKSVKALGGVTRSSRIVLATKILDTPDRLRDTLVHEMCHAAAWLINEVSDGHGPFWKGWASKAMRAFPELPPIRRCHEYEIKTKFTYRCVGCGYSIGRHSKSLDVEKKRCGHCYGKFELLINKITKSGTVEVKTPTTKKPSAFALFVKENFSKVKNERKGIAHKEVMQILGQQFSAIKISKKNGNSDENDSDIPLNV